MCGIGVLVCGACVDVEDEKSVEEEVWTAVSPCACCCSGVGVADFLSVLEPRGPDATHTLQVKLPGTATTLTFLAATLHMRGHQLVRQPVQLENGSVLLWNGEVFGFGADGHDLEQTNDIAFLSRALEAAVTKQQDRDYPLRVLHRIRGPGSFVYWDSQHSTLWFGRDALGRRSLLINACQHHDSTHSPTFHLSSTAAFADASQRSPPWTELPPSLYTLRFAKPDESSSVTHCTLASVPWEASCLCPRSVPKPLQRSSAVRQFHAALHEAVRKRVCFTCQKGSEGEGTVSVLFSGGIDCMVLAALSHLSVAPGQPIDLINVAFVGQREANLSTVCVPFHTLTLPDRVTAINGVLELRRVFPTRQWRLVEVDVSLREMEEVQDHILALIHPASTVMDFNIATMFWFAARGRGVVRHHCYLNPISSPFCRYLTPDPSEEKEEKEENEEEQAPRGVPEVCKHTSTARVLLVGLGADEQLGGYGRHRTRFRVGGPNALVAELEKDLFRLWRRNLGRDDRVMADVAREVRHPFLDEDVVACIRSLPLDCICDLALPAGVGDKRILRTVGYELGLLRGSSLQKRAIQFGTRIANRRVAGYVQMTSTVKLCEVVNQDLLNERNCSVRAPLSKKANKQKNKPGFE